MLTQEQLKDAGIFPDADAQDCMWVESGLEWLKAYTTLPIGTIDGDTLSALPAGAKLFLQQYRDTVQGGNVTSESIEGLSQSFSSDGICNSLIALAQGAVAKMVYSSPIRSKAAAMDIQTARKVGYIL